MSWLGRTGQLTGGRPQPVTIANPFGTPEVRGESLSRMPQLIRAFQSIGNASGRRYTASQAPPGRPCITRTAGSTKTVHRESLHVVWLEQCQRDGVEVLGFRV